MANEKKYVDLLALDYYDGKIKDVISTGDAATLKSAKDYADGLATNYDAAGSAAGAQAAAKSYTDGQITTVNGVIAGVKTTAEQGVSDAAKAQAAADKAQGEVDALETYVGTFTHATAKSVVEYVDAKTAGIASDAALTALTTRVTTAEGEIDAIQADYLKAADKTTLEGKITAEATARETADNALSGRLDEVEAFFKLAEGQQLDEALDTLVEIQTYIAGDGAAAEQMVKDIAANKAAIEKEVADRGTAISGVETAYQAADEGLSNRIATLEGKFEGDNSVAEQIAAAVEAEAKLRAAGDQAAEGKAAAAQSAADKAQGEVDALEGVVETLTQTVNGKVAQGDHDALADRVTTAEGEIDALQRDTHTHDNKGVLDGITATLIANWNEAHTKMHEHSNKTVLDGITSTKVSAWDAAEGNAKAYTDQKIGEFVAVTNEEIDGLFA